MVMVLIQGQFGTGDDETCASGPATNNRVRPYALEDSKPACIQPNYVPIAHLAGLRLSPSLRRGGGRTWVCGSLRDLTTPLSSMHAGRVG